MSSHQLLETLRHLGYLGADRLDTSSLDWMFDNEAVLPFLHCLCTAVSEENLLSTQQIQQYDALCGSSEGVLEGAQLDQALQALSVKDDDDISDEALQEEISKLQEEKEHCKHKKQHLLQQRNRLSVHFSSLTHRQSQLPQLEKAAKKRYKQTMEQSQAESLKTDASLKTLSRSLDAVCGLYRSAGTALQTAGGSGAMTDSGDTPCFLSQINLDAYHEAEHKFTEQLTDFTKKKFFEGIADMAGRNDSTRYELLEISNPQSLRSHSDKEKVNVEDCHELARLESLFPQSECERVNGVISERSVEEACRAAEERVQGLRAHPCTSNARQLSEQLGAAQSKLMQLQEKTSLLTNQVAALIKDSSGLQVSKILSGDYNLKIVRQDYFISNQDQVIDELVVQRTRYELLKILYELEAQQHRQMRHLLAAAAQHLTDANQNMHDRLKMMGDSTLSVDRHQRGTINSRDKTMMNLYHILTDFSGSLEPQLYISNESLVKAAESLRHSLSTLESSSSSNNNAHSENLEQLEQNLSRCKEVVYADSSSTVGVPHLSPQAVRDAISQLTTMLSGLEQSIIDIMKDIGQKKEMLNSDTLLKKEREIYLHFFNQPDRLGVLTAQLSAGIDSLELQ